MTPWTRLGRNDHTAFGPEHEAGPNQPRTREETGSASRPEYRRSDPPRSAPVSGAATFDCKRASHQTSPPAQFAARSGWGRPESARRRLGGAAIWGLALSAALVVLTGCDVSSVFPFFAEKDVVTDDAILGTWKDSEGYEIKRGEGKAYEFAMLPKNDKQSGTLHLFELGGVRFMDLHFKTIEAPQMIEPHLLCKVHTLQPTVKVVWLKASWVKAQLAKNPQLRPASPGEKSDVVLAGSTADLRQFLLKNKDNPEAWDTETEWKREAAGK